MSGATVRARRQRRTARRGFTLLEIMLVLALSFVGLYGISTVLLVAQRSAAAARTITEATALAQDKLEQVGHLPLSALVSSNEAGLGPTGVPVVGGAYARVTTVTVNGLVYTVRVQVSWTDMANRAHAVTLATQRAP